MNTNVNHKIAHLLKEKGFKQSFLDVQKYYYPETKELTENHRGDNYPAPTIAEVVMWLYEKHEIWVEIRFADDYKIFFYDIINTKNLKAITSKSVSHFNSPTEAYEAAIEYILNNLI